MNAPRIRYDVLANAQGEEDVERLAAELEKLDEAIDPQAAARARALADELRNLADKRQAIEAFLRSLAEADAASKALDQAGAALQRLERRLEGVEKPTRSQAGQLEKLRDAANRAQTAFTEKTGALNSSRVALERMGVGTKDLGTKQQILTTAIQATKAQVQQLGAAYQQTAAAAVTSAARQVKAQGEVRSAVEQLNDTYRRLQGIAALAIGGGVFTGLIRDAAQTADEFKNLQARIRLVTGEGPAFEQFFQGVADVAQRTNASLESTGNLFVRIAESGVVSQQEALSLTETINQSIALSGGGAASASAAITQLIQGLQSGVLRGEEFNSVVEQSPRLAKALADGLGIARGELRQLANDGALTAEVVIKALQGQSAAVEREFEQLPATVGRALQNLSNSWTLYVGEVDAANGVSEKAAGLINALAENLDTLGAVLLSVGKATLAYQALKLAQTLLGIGTAAKVATAEVAALGAAQAAAGAAGAGAAANVSRFAGLLAGLKAFTLVGLLTNLREIGTALGEGAAKLLGYGDAIERAEEQMRADEAATRANAVQKQELAEQARKAAEAAQGLTKEAKALVGEFEGLEKKGESTAEALAKVGKNLQLGEVQGIADAGAALDALALRGKITGEQVRDTLGAALKDLDLGTFRTQALAAFDGSEQGVRRLEAALTALDAEALRRAGTSLRELTTGFSAGATAALNDVDALAAALDRTGARSSAAGQLLAEALDKATEASNTEEAVQAVIERLEELGAQGKLSGEQLTQGLENARKKLDELQPGISSLAEAYKQFGLKTKAELQGVADKNKAAWQTIRNDATLSLSQKQQAFKQYAESAIAANGGVADSNLKSEAAALKVQIQVDKTGQATVDAMDKASRAVEATTKRFNELGQEVNEYGDAINQAAGSISSGWEAATKARNEAVGSNGFSDFDSADYRNNVTRDAGGIQVDVPDGYYYTLDPNAPGVERRAGYTRSGQPIPGYFARLTPAPGGSQGGPFGGSAGAPRPAPAGAPPAAAPAAARPSTSSEPVETIRVVHEVAGRGFSSVMTAQDAEQFVAALAKAKASGG